MSSIKKIIAEDSSKGLSAPRPRKFAPREPEPEALDEADQVPADDVLELTETAEEAMTLDTPIADSAPETIVSDTAAVQSRSALDALSALVVKPEIEGSDTLEGMVREMLRPMMKEWLDANLPRVVEGMVSREIARISGKPLT